MYFICIMDLIQNESTTMYHAWRPKHPSSEFFFAVDELDSLPMKGNGIGASLGGGFKYCLFLPPGKCSNLTSIFFKWLGENHQLDSVYRFDIFVGGMESDGGGMTEGVSTVNRVNRQPLRFWFSIPKNSNTTSDALQKKYLHVYMRLGRWQNTWVDRDDHGRLEERWAPTSYE